MSKVISGIIYKVTNNTNGKSYIGQTIDKLSRRKSGHKCRFKSGKYKNSILYLAFEKFGWENFSWSVIDECGTKEELDRLEKLYIENLNTKSPNGYNLTDGGDGGTLGYEHTGEDRKRMSNLKDGMYYGRDNPFYGKTHSEEARKVISATNSRDYIIKFPDGQEKRITNLTLFCNEHGLDRSAMYKVLSGKYKRHKGFKIKKCAKTQSFNEKNTSNLVV